jgi:hypothetical protein
MRSIKRINNLKDGVSLNGWQLHSPRYALPAQFQQLVMREDEIDYDAVVSGFERFEQKHRIVNGEVEEKETDGELIPPASFKSLHKRFYSQQLTKAVTFKESPQPEVSPAEPTKPADLPKPADPPKLFLLPQAETAPITPVIRSQASTPYLLPDIKPKHIPHRHSRPLIPRLPMDVIDSVKVEKTCRLVVRSLRPQAFAPELLPSSRRASALKSAEFLTGQRETEGRRTRRQGTMRQTLELRT